MKRLYISIHIAGVLVLAASAAFAQKPDQGLVTRIQAHIDGWHKAGKFPGATVGVVLADDRSFALATGYSDTTAKTKMKPADRMEAGSVGKTFAAAVAMQLIDERKIS